MKYNCEECLIGDGNNPIKFNGSNDNIVMYVCDKCLDTFVKEDYEILQCDCGSVDIDINQNSEEDRPYILLTEYKCNKCKSYWYDED